MPRSARTVPRDRGPSDETLVPAGANAAFRALDAAEVRWCVLRGEPAAAEPDIDLLVPSDDMERAERALGSAGFIEQRAWGYRPHRFFWHVGVAGRTKLDVVTELRFGPAGGVRIAGVDGIAGRRRRTGGLWRVDPGDEFWTTLLHALLDKPTLLERHRARLLEPAATAALASPVVDRLFRSRADAEAIVEAVEGGRWSPVVAWAKALEPAGAGAAAARSTRAVARRIGWRLRPLRRRGVTVALLAPDGAGKTTLTNALAGGFPIPVRSIYMGLYRTGGRRLPPGIGLASRVGLQWIRYGRGAYHRARGRVVLFDRYTDDAGLDAGGPSGSRDRLRRRVLAGVVPRPDLILVLDAPAEELHRRKGEHDSDHLEAARRHYRAVAESSRRRAAVLDATRPPEAVAGEAAALIWDTLRTRS